MAGETIGFIGLGIMGRPMALNLIKAGYTLVVTSRSRGPIDALVAAGAKAAATPADVAREADVVVTMVPDTPDVELVIRGANGVLERPQARRDRHRHEHDLARRHAAIWLRPSRPEADRCSTRR